MPDTTMSAREALEEMHELLRTSCREQSPPRPDAARYQSCRTTLINGPLGAWLPGFLRQCVSLMKFREFICLYDHDPAARMKFVDRSLEACWTHLKDRPTYDIFDADDF